MMIEVSVHQKDITILNVYAPRNMASQILEINTARRQATHWKEIPYFAVYNAHLHFCVYYTGIIIPITILTVCNHYCHV